MAAFNIISFILPILLLAHAPLRAQNTPLQPADTVIHYQSLFNKNSKPGVACFRIPSLVTAPGGTLIAAIDERVSGCGDLKWNSNINIVIRRSKDEGKTWLPIQTVVDYPEGQSASDPSMIVDKETGTIFLFFNFMDLNKEKDVYYLRVTTSVDDGKTWSKPLDITSQITPDAWHRDFKFITSGRGIQTRSGKLLHTLVNLEKGLFVFGSNDHGKSWVLLPTPVKPADESKLVELSDGTWMVNSRVNGAGERYVHTSTDEGETWSTRADSTLADPGCNAGILRYTSAKDGRDKNRLLFSNLNSKEERKNLTVRISYDEGKSWAQQKVIYAGSAAYSSLTVLPNGAIGLFFEKDDYQETAFVSFTLDWLTDGRDKGSDFKE